MMTIIMMMMMMMMMIAEQWFRFIYLYRQTFYSVVCPKHKDLCRSAVQELLPECLTLSPKCFITIYISRQLFLTKTSTYCHNTNPNIKFTLTMIIKLILMLIYPNQSVTPLVVDPIYR